MKKENFQERFLLTLDNTKNSKTARKILKSPLDLAIKTTHHLFENNFGEMKENLDSIKYFVAGIKRAKQLGNNYRIANYFTYLFAFQQFFHSSYRARQGKALEELSKVVVRNLSTKFKVPDSNKRKRQIVARAVKGYSSDLDLDLVVGKGSSNKILVMQLRSRDNTGGTTAKASLVDALKEILQSKIKSGGSLYYLIGVWDKVDSNQKQSTINKLYSSLKPYLSKKLTKKRLTNEIENGVEVKKGICLELAYGKKAIEESINQWTKRKSNIAKVIDKILNWDDLWLSYVIASMELENQTINGFDNITYLNKLLDKKNYNHSSFTRNNQFLILANDLALQIIPSWKKDSIQARSAAEKAHYIRDLILLKFIYEVS